MRVIWDDKDNRFLAELTPGEQWREDMEAVKAAGFKTDGPPAWSWHTTKASVLNKLRENRPKSGLVLTEVALTHYQTINQKEEEKTALKKQFKQAQKLAKKTEKFPERKTYFDEELQITCLFVEPKTTEFTMPKISTVTSADRCMVCEDPLYCYDYNLICIWCKKELENNA
jgi:hypothetical protein